MKKILICGSNSRIGGLTLSVHPEESRYVETKAWTEVIRLILSNPSDFPPILLNPPPDLQIHVDAEWSPPDDSDARIFQIRVYAVTDAEDDSPELES